jgi:23S rRNA pseudouridine1911/1915/1917 synthase
MAESLVVLFEDPHCLAVTKPAGLRTQPAEPSAPSLEALVRRHLSADSPNSVYLGTVHRLDRPVSGVVLWAKTPKAARRLAAQFAAHEVQKEYWAIVAGAPSRFAPEATWDDWLASPDAGGVARVVPPLTPGARRALTRVRTGLGARLPAETTWLRLWPETGRTHQLRAQAASRGAPILNDVRYGSTQPFPEGIALHARALAFRHPSKHVEVAVVAPLPESWQRHGIALPETADTGGPFHSPSS